MGIQKSPSQYRKELKVATDGALIVLEDYKGARTKIKHRCLKCRWEWSCEPSNVLSHGSRCPRWERMSRTKLSSSYARGTSRTQALTGLGFLLYAPAMSLI